MSRPILVTRRADGPYVLRGLLGDVNPAPDRATVDVIAAHYHLAVTWDHPRTPDGDGRTCWTLEGKP